MVTQRGSTDEAVELICACFIRNFVIALRFSSGALTNRQFSPERVFSHTPDSFRHKLELQWLGSPQMSLQQK
jgi:hypothetical protein